MSDDTPDIREEVSDEILRELQDVIARPVAQPVRAFESLHPVDVFSRARQRRMPDMRLPRGTSEHPLRAFLGLIPWFLGASVVVGGLLYISNYGLHVKGRIVQQGSAAINHLLSAKNNLERFDFDAAEMDFTQAQQRFTAAAGEMDVLGPNLIGLSGKIPGLKSLWFGHNLVQAGEHISDAGQAITEAMAAISKAGGILDTRSTDRLALGEVFLPLQAALSRADEDMRAAVALLAPVPVDTLPEDSREQYQAFRDRLPELQALIAQGNEAVAFLSRLTGADRPRRYLLLFQNSSELRPTGGFPGSYGLITFEDGRIKDIRADDIYNPDGQIKDLIVPPLQLQHITPSWGMRDASWFIDFSASARKVAAFYQRGGGAAVDGVIAIRPDMVSEILRVIGPVSLPHYDVVLTADNFLSTVQLEVESQKTAQPKQIIMDLAPVLMQRIATLPASQWIQIMQVFRKNLQTHDMMLYFDDQELQSYATAQQWDGAVRDTEGDYLAVNIANIKGVKADAVTDTSVKLESRLDGGTMVHRLTLTRQHNGGSTPYGFYNKTNYSYVRVLVPHGSTLRGITGNDHPSNRPLMQYTAQNSQTDPDLVALERTYQHDAATDDTTFEESGKTGFGFWMKVEPGKTQHVQLEYVVPARVAASAYHLVVQRQPGLDISDFELTIEKSGGTHVAASVPSMTEWPDSWRLHDGLDQDLEFSATLDR